MACRHAYKMLDRAEELTCEECLFEVKAQEYERGLKDKTITVTREWIENLVSDLNASYIGYHGSKPGYKVIGDALHSLGVTVEKSAGS